MKHLFTLAIILTFSKSAFAQNNMLEFDGTNDYVSISSINLNGESQITLEAWVHPESFNTIFDNYISNIVGYENADALLRIGDNDGSNMVDDNRMQFVITTGSGNKKCNGTIELSQNQWYHVAGTYDGSNLRLYVNGVLDASVSHSGILSVSVPEIILGAGTVSGSDDRCLDGFIDEVRVWTTARTQTQIRQNMYRELSGSESGLFAYYKLNETSGTSASDSKSSYNGSLTNMSGNEWETSPAMFGPKNCLDFDGNDDNVEVTSLSPAWTQGTLSFWIKLDNIPSVNARIISEEWGDDEIYIQASDGRLATLGIVPGDDIVSSDPLPTGEWTHIALSSNSTETKLYINGELDVTKGAGNFSFDNVDIGGQFTSGWEVIDGQLDELRLWNTVKTVSEIRENMFKILTGNESGLIAYYTFDNTTGSTLQDFSGNNNDGNLTNMANEDWVPSDAFNTWLNTSNSSWSTATNWSRGSVPGFSDNIGVYSYSGGNDIAVNSAQNAGSLVLGTSASMSLNEDLYIVNNLILESDLDLNGQTIELSSSGLLIEDSGRLYGTSGIIQTTRNFSGSINENIAGLGIHLSTNGGTGNTTIIRGHAAQTGGGNESIQRYFEITPQWVEFTNADIIFHYNENELNGLTESSLHLYRSDDDGATWTDQEGTVNTTENTITLSGITSFSRWTAGGTGDMALPVELSSFHIQNTSSGIKLNWKTQTETDNAGFILLRDGVEVASYENTDALKGHGTTSQAQNYTYIDNDVTLDASYTYQLVSMDYSGLRHSYPQSVKVTVTQAPDGSGKAYEYALSQNYPNPFNPGTTIRFAMKTDGLASVKVFDLLGRNVFEKTLEAKKGENSLYFNAENLTSGIYFYQLDTKGFNKTMKMLLVK
jgi:hypothetical protein